MPKDLSQNRNLMTELSKYRWHVWVMSTFDGTMLPSSKYKQGCLVKLKERVKCAIGDVGELAERLCYPLKKRQKKDQSEKKHCPA
jgi:hypothetical protein